MNNKIFIKIGYYIVYKVSFKNYKKKNAKNKI